MTAPVTPPARRARRHHWRAASFVALDFELTGLDRRRDDIVSFGAVPVDRARVELAGARQAVVAATVSPSPASIRVHQLRPLDVAGGIPLEQARAILADALEARYVLAWVADIEVAFLARTFGHRRSWWRRSIDVARLASHVDRLENGSTHDRSLSLAAAVQRFGVPTEEHHDALDDAIMTAQVFLVLANRLEAQTDLRVSTLLSTTHRRGTAFELHR